MKEKDCYNCKFRGNVSGSAHSCCNVIRGTVSDKEKGLELELLLASHQVEMTRGGEPIVKLNKHGIANGWANWPLDFDPTWVESCEFHTEKN